MPIYHRPCSLETSSLNKVVDSVADACRRVHKNWPHDVERHFALVRPGGIIQTSSDVLLNHTLVRGDSLSTVHMHVDVFQQKQVMPLRSWCTLVLIRHTWNRCMAVYRHVRAIHDYVQTIPRHLADAYTEAMMDNALDAMIYTRSPWKTYGAYHRACTRFKITRYINRRSTSLDSDALEHLPIMRDLMVVHLDLTDLDKLIESIPYLGRLRTLGMPYGIVRDHHQLPQLLSRHCPNLQELDFTWGMTANQRLDGCPNLKRVNVTYLGLDAQQVRNILDSVPHLTSLSVGQIELDEVIQACPGPYPGMQAISTRVSQMLPDLVRAFPNLTDLSLDVTDLDGPLTPLNDLQHLRELALTTLTLTTLNPEKMIRIRQCLSRLKLLGLIRVDHLDATLLEQVPLPNLKCFSAIRCTGVDLENLWRVMPNLTSLLLTDSSVSNRTLQFGMTDAPFRHLETLLVMDYHGYIEYIHLRCLMSHCVDLKTLSLICHDILDDRTLVDLVSRMTRLKVLSINCPTLTLEVLPMLFEVLGDETECVKVHFSHLDESPEVISQVFSKYKRYRGLKVFLRCVGHNNQDEGDEDDLLSVGSTISNDDNDNDDDEDDDEDDDLLSVGSTIRNDNDYDEDQDDDDDDEGQNQPPQPQGSAAVFTITWYYCSCDKRHGDQPGCSGLGCKTYEQEIFS